MNTRRREVFAGSAVAVLLLTAGCGISEKSPGKTTAVQPVSGSKQLGSAYDSGGAYGADETEPGAGSGYGENPSAAPEGGGVKTGPAGRLQVREVPDLGGAVTDAEGLTLYRFDKDTAQPPKSTCDGDCAKAWPAVAADDASAGEGIDSGLLGSVERADGTRQLTLAGWPVYRYAKDTKAGDTLGEGVGGTWHVLGADGKPAVAGKTAPEAAKKDAEVGLSVNQNAKLGNILADAEGRTLYRFDKDSAWPMKFGCLGTCLDTWKPAKAVEKDAVSGISPELVGKVKRPDGTEQMTIDCWPVYWFTGDVKPGDINGHAKQGLWFAVTDKGKKAKGA